MRSVNGLGKTVVNWQLLSDNIKPHLAEMPQVQPIAVELEAQIAEIRAIDNEQEVARMRFRELTRRRREAEKKGEALRRRVAAHLRGTFGFTSEQLIQFGINPRPTTRTRKSYRIGTTLLDKPDFSSPRPSPSLRLFKSLSSL